VLTSSQRSSLPHTFSSKELGGGVSVKLRRKTGTNVIFVVVGAAARPQCRDRCLMREIFRETKCPNSGCGCSANALRSLSGKVHVSSSELMPAQHPIRDVASVAALVASSHWRLQAEERHPAGWSRKEGPQCERS
jgi:hypothetical protein